MRRAALAAAAVAAAVAPGSAAAHSASISGGTTSANWTQGQVDNVLLVMDHCGTDPSCEWEAVAGVVPTSRGFCPTDWAAGGSVGFTTFWHSGYRAADGAVQSGPRQFALDGTVGQRVCLYLERTFGGGARESRLWLSKRLTSPYTQTPPDEGLTADAAASEAKRALARRFGRRFKRGHRRRVRCVERSEAKFDCAVRWFYKGDRYKGDVVVSIGADGTLATKIDVRRRP